MIDYIVNPELSALEFINVLQRSGLAARRPISDMECIEGMLEGASLMVAAYDGDLLVGIARSVTDFHYCCYLSDLAVDQAYQRQGIGADLIARTQDELGDQCKLILLSAPAAVDYYPHIGFEHHPQAWVLGPDAIPKRKP